jgi:glucose/mannose-6-phosphate isomerase
MMLDDVLAIPDHLRDALWRVESARLQPADAAGLLVCGMGGSAIGGDLAAAALGERCTRPLMTVRGYELPSWVTPEWTVLCSSYSGATEETVACFAAAEALGARRVVASTGGQLTRLAREAGVPVVGLPGVLTAPRAAVAYMFVIAAEVAALAGVAPGLRTEIDGAGAHLERAREALRQRAAEIAAKLDQTAPIIYGADATVAAAYRWKTQINENSKLMSFAGELPEADHNEVVGWAGRGASAGFSAVFLVDADQHPRERRRIEVTAELIEDAGGTAIQVESEGDSRTARLLWTVMLGDLVSLELAEARGTDPAPIEAIDRLKDRLGPPR